VNNVVDLTEEFADWTIGGLAYANTTSDAGHNTQIQSGKTLVVSGNLHAWYNIGVDHSWYTGLIANVTGGVLHVGTESQHGDLFVSYVPGAGSRGIRGTLTVTSKGFAPLLRNVVIGASDANHNDVRPGWGYLDLRGTPIVGGAFSAENMTVGKGSLHVGAVYLNDACALANLSVSGTLAIGTYGSTGNLGVSENSWKLPANVNVAIGVDDAARGSLVIGTAGESQGHNAGVTGTGSLVADSGGTFTAYLTSMQVGYSTQFNFTGALGVGTLDISTMDSVVLDVSGTATIGECTTENGRYTAAVKLPAGSASVGALRLGVGGLGTRSALLQLNGTEFAVAASATIGAKGTLDTTIDGVSCGLSLEDPSAAALAVVAGGKIQITFLQDQITPGGVYWGLRWKGDHTSTLNSLVSAGKIIVDAGGAPGKSAGVLYDAGTGYTCVTLAESWPLTAIPRNLSYEVYAPDHLIVVITVDDIDAGSFDPSGHAIVERTIASADDSDSDPATVTLTGEGTYTVTLTVKNDIGEIASADSTVILTEPIASYTDLTWSGASTEGTEWRRSANWSGNQVPANPTTGRMTFGNTGIVTDATITNTVDPEDYSGSLASWTVGGLHYANYMAGGHNTQINAGKSLVVDGDFSAWHGIGTDHSTYSGQKASITGGTLQVGTEETPRDMRVVHNTKWLGIQGVLTVRTKGFVPHVRDLLVEYCDELLAGGPRTSTAVLDIQDTPIVGGTLAVRNLHVARGSYNGAGTIRLNAASNLQNLQIAGACNVGVSSVGLIGDPNNGNKLPGGVNVSIGVDEAARGSLTMGVDGWAQDWTSAWEGRGTLIASGGGSFTAYLTSMTVGLSEHNHTNALGTGTLDLAAMDSVMLDVAGPVRIGEATQTNGRFVAKVVLPQGTASVGSLNVGVGGLGTRSGLLQLNNTRFSAYAAAIGATGTVDTNVDGASCGLSIEDPAGTALSVADGGKINVVFLQDELAPSAMYWGLRWKGDHKSALYALNTAGKLFWDDAAVAPKTAGVYYDPDTDYTCVTVRAAWPPTAVAKDLAIDIYPPDHETVVLSADDIDGGSFDPSGLEIVERTISCPQDTDADPATVTLTGAGDYEVTLTIKNSGGETASDTGTVTLAIPTPSTGNLLWVGTDPAKPLWTRSVNWQGGTPPANPTTGTITFNNVGLATDATVTNVVNPQDYFDSLDTWTVGGLIYANYTAGGHNTQISDGKTLVVAGNLLAWYNIGVDHTMYAGMKTTISGGTLQVGTPDLPGDLFLSYIPATGWRGVRGTLTISATALTPYLRDVVIAASDDHRNDVRPGWGYLDLRSTPITDGTFSARNVTIGKGSLHVGQIIVNDDCALTGLNVSGALVIGSYGSNGRIGNPDDEWRLPAGANVNLGVDADNRGSLTIGTAGVRQDYNGGYTGDGRLAANAGGAFTAWLTGLRVGYSTDFNFSTAVGAGTLDLAAMDSVMLNVSGTAAIGESTTANGRYTARVALPPGTASANALRLGIGGAGTRSALLELNGTRFAVASSAAIGAAGTVNVNVGAGSAGLDLADGASLSVDDGGIINIVFSEDPAAPGVHWGLRWAGDRSTELQALADAGKLTWDDSALTTPAAIVAHGGNTYVGVAVAMASITEFTVTDATSGSTLVTNAAGVNVAITAEPAEGAAIVGFAVNETGIEPAEGWTAPLAAYTITAADGANVTLYAWAKDSAGNVAGASAVIYYNTTAPAVSGLVITDNGDGTATAAWTTDIPAEGSVNYGPVSLTGATPNSAPGNGLTTSHSATLTGIAAGTNYKIVLVNTEVASAPVFWPRPWPIDGDSNMDCRVNILDLIFIRNKLNLDVSSGDNWKADVNLDTRINILDLIYVRNKLNTQCP